MTLSVTPFDIRLEEIKSFTVVGISTPLPPNSPLEIPKLWDLFLSRVQEISQQAIAGAGSGVRTYGLINYDENLYVAGVEIQSATDVPDGMIAVTVPAGLYNVFAHRGPSTRIPESWDAVARRPALDGYAFAPKGRLGLERYVQAFDATAADTIVELCVPVQKVA